MRLIDADALLDDVMDRYCKKCDKRKGIKNGEYRVIYDIGEAPCRACEVDDMKSEVEDAPTILESLPSAQSEQLTDKEQRIFLAAMGREREVCKKVDEEWSDGEFGDLYETVNLERVCTEIERKVKGALWT